MSHLSAASGGASGDPAQLPPDRSHSNESLEPKPATAQLPTVAIESSVPPRGADPLVELCGISKTLGDRKILDRVDFAIYPNEAIAIIGPSGTGKSTILRVISGLLEPDEGEVRLLGEPRLGLLGDSHEPEGIDIKLVFQQAALFDSLTVGENIGFSLLEAGKLSLDRIQSLVDRALERVGLPPIADRYPAELSGGMKKRVSFARAIIENPAPDGHLVPEVLLYDEPTAGLDPIASTIVEDLMRELSRKVDFCSTYVVVTHQDSTIRRTADRVVFLYDGKIRWQGSVHDIDATDDPYVRQFFSSAIEGPIQTISA
ncbi:MAG: ATP-binding cassette domain-containing protein [Oscillatoriales cyanobacterium]|nr:MAG: ATP-binding cassette domain-containing protein [Oscillatoriales cyanobacterium]